MAIANAVMIRRRAREVPQRFIAARLNMNRSRVARALGSVDDVAAVMAVLGLEVVGTHDR